jgi:hypothetical protein
MVGKQLGIYAVQPDYYRAPEVILGLRLAFQGGYLELWCVGKIPCDYLLPCWLQCWFGLNVNNPFGKLWNILGSQELFQQLYGADGKYDAVTPGRNDCSTWSTPQGIAREIKDYVRTQLAPACRKRHWQIVQ